MIQSVDNGDRFRTFQFIFAVAIVHEIGGHLLVTFLTNGRSDSPLALGVQGYNGRNIGESGRWLELSLFGGTSEFYRDRQIWDDNTQVS
jgi:hypothetical protein